MGCRTKNDIMRLIDRYVDLVEANLTDEQPSESQLEATKKAYNQLQEMASDFHNMAIGPSEEEIIQLYNEVQKRNNKTSLVQACSCGGWGCWNCCSSEQEIRSRQGTFG